MFKLFNKSNSCEKIYKSISNQLSGEGNIKLTKSTIEIGEIKVNEIKKFDLFIANNFNFDLNFNLKKFLL